MSDSRSTILNSIRRSLSSAQLPEKPTASLAATVSPLSADELARQFADELGKLNGVFLVVPRPELAPTLVRLLQERQAARVLAWSAEQLPVPGLLEAVRAAGLEVVSGEVDRQGRRAAQLTDEEKIVVGITGADAALADTATLALLSGPGRPRLAAMSVRTHIALITPEQLYPSLADWIARQPTLAARLRENSQLLLISGPSRTADIEMTLTVGVHGPGEVIVVLAQG